MRDAKPKSAGWYWCRVCGTATEHVEVDRRMCYGIAVRRLICVMCNRVNKMWK